MVDLLCWSEVGVGLGRAGRPVIVKVAGAGSARVCRSPPTPGGHAACASVPRRVEVSQVLIIRSLTPSTCGWKTTIGPTPISYQMLAHCTALGVAEVHLVAWGAHPAPHRA